MNSNKVDSEEMYTTEDEKFVNGGEGEKVSKGSGKENGGGNVLRRMMEFLKQVVWELKKTVWPTRSELVSYTIIVLIFVTVMMVILAAWDFALGRLFFEIFGG